LRSSGGATAAACRGARGGAQQHLTTSDLQKDHLTSLSLLPKEQIAAAADLVMCIRSTSPTSSSRRPNSRAPRRLQLQQGTNSACALPKRILARRQKGSLSVASSYTSGSLWLGAPPGFSPAAPAQLTGSTISSPRQHRLLAGGSVSARQQLCPATIGDPKHQNV
jgi:hypothetical protein